MSSSMTTELNAATISSVMSMDGPTVNAVVLKANGEVEQVSIDTSPKLNATASILKGNPTFVGQWPSLNVVIMCSHLTGEDWPENQHKLPNPFTKFSIKGDIVLLRMDEEAVPADFTKDEWERFTAEADYMPEDEDEEEDEEEFAPIQIAASSIVAPVEEEEDDEEGDQDFEAEDDDEDDDEDDEDENAPEDRDENDVRMEDTQASKTNDQTEDQ